MRKLVVGLTGMLLATCLQVPAGAVVDNEIRLDAFAHWVDQRDASEVVKHHLKATLVVSRTSGVSTFGTVSKEVCTVVNDSATDCEVRKSESFASQGAALTIEPGLAGAHLVVDVAGRAVRVSWNAVADLQRRWLDDGMVELYRNSDARGRLLGSRLGRTRRAAVNLEAPNELLCKWSQSLCG